MKTYNLEYELYSRYFDEKMSEEFEVEDDAAAAFDRFLEAHSARLEFNEMSEMADSGDPALSAIADRLHEIYIQEAAVYVMSNDWEDIDGEGDPFWQQMLDEMVCGKFVPECWTLEKHCEYRHLSLTELRFQAEDYDYDDEDNPDTEEYAKYLEFVFEQEYREKAIRSDIFEAADKLGFDIDAIAEEINFVITAAEE